MRTARRLLVAIVAGLVTFVAVRHWFADPPSWPDKAFWPDWAFYSARHEFVVIPLILVAITLLVYGVALLVSVWRRPAAARYGLLNPRRWIVDDYDYWLGAWFGFDSLIWGVLAAATLRTPHVDLWVALLFDIGGVPALLAFRLWLVGNLRRR